MLTIDWVMLMMFFSKVANDLLFHEIFLAALAGAAAATLILWAMYMYNTRVIGRILQIAVGIIWTPALCIVADLVLKDSETGVGLLTAFRESYPVLFYILFAVLTLVFIFLQLRYIGEVMFAFDRRGVKMFFYSIYYHLRYSKAERERMQEYVDRYINGKGPTEKDLQHELDRYHDLFSRINRLIDEITRSKAFRVGGDELMEHISAYMSFIQENNTTVERMPEDLSRTEDPTTRESLIRYIQSINGKMAGYESMLQAGFEKIKAQYGSETEEKTSRKRRSSAGSMPQDPRITMFFNGCDTREKLDKRYKSLAKTYHPDMDSGDTETMALINQEYERLKAFLGE